MADSTARPLMLLVHRPGRMMTIIAAAVLVVGGIVLIALQSRNGPGTGWWSIALLLPMVVGFAAIMRTGTTRCEVLPGEHALVVRSVDGSQLLGRGREVAFRWFEIRGAAWGGRAGAELRVRFASSPAVLVFSGPRRDLEMLRQVVDGRTARHDG